MMNLYREFGVNPVGGCLPVLVQMPIFIGFYVMLQNVVELRGASFLWIHDLTQPDTVAHLAGYDLNLLPILMTATSFLVMRMTPQAADNSQMKVMQFMPLVLMVILYNFAAALALYWTINNLISMAQTYINLRRPVPVLKRVPKKKPMLMQ
jgi:YidC/Oxa1 family membrane protein insertase